MTNKIETNSNSYIYTMPHEILKTIASFIEKPSDIVRIHEVSELFSEVICTESCRLFLKKHQGYYFGSIDLYNAFTSYMLRIYDLHNSHHLQAIKAHPRYSVYLSRTRLIYLDNVDELLCRKNTSYGDFWLHFGRTIFPSLMSTNVRFNEVAARQDGERFYQICNRVSIWLKETPAEQSKITEISHRSINNQFLYFIPIEITFFAHLQTLELRDHYLMEVPDFLYHMKSLKNLFLQNNQIAAVHCPFVRMPQLEEVSLVGNRLDDLPPPHLFSKKRPLIFSLNMRAILDSLKKLDKYPFVFIRLTHDQYAENRLEAIVTVTAHNLTVIKNNSVDATLARLWEDKLLQAEVNLAQLKTIQTAALTLLRSDKENTPEEN